MRERLTRLLLPAMQLGMQACWLYAWLSLIEMRLLDRIVIAPIAILFAAAGALARAGVERLPLRSVARVACYWILWFAIAAFVGKLLLYPAMAWGQSAWVFALPRSLLRLIFETQSAELLLLLGSACAWYLGGRAVSRPASYETLLGQFQFGLLLLFGAFLLAHGLGVQSGHPVLLSLGFFALSLTGIAITRSRQGGESASVPSGRHFTGSLLTLVAVVSVLGLLAGIAITPDLVGSLIDVGRAILNSLGSALLFLFSLLPAPDAPSGAEMQPPATGDDAGLLEFYRTLPWPALLRRALFILWVVVVIGMFLFALWRLCSALLEWLKRRSNVSGIEIESLDTGLLADLLALLLWLDRKVRQAASYVTRIARRTMGSAGEPTWTSVYAGLVRWAARKVQPRHPSQSVNEYQAALGELLPAATADLAFVTDTYARARYGGHEPDGSTVQEMHSAVHRIRRAPRRRGAGHTNTQTEGAE